MIYLLSILDKISTVVGAVSIVTAIIFGIVMIFAIAMLDLDYNMKDQRFSSVTKMLKITGVVSLATAILSCFIPTQTSLMKAYLMLEGNKIVNAENSTKFANEVGNKVDNLINVIDHRLNKADKQPSEQ